MRKTPLPLPRVAQSIAIVAVVCAVLVAPSFAGHEDEGGLSDLGDAMQQEGGADQALCEKVSYSPEFARWYKVYLAGNDAAAEKEWKGVMKQLVGAEDLKPLLRLINSRLAFADVPPGAEDRLNIRACDKKILVWTINTVGADNLMVRSIQWFVASTNSPSKHDEVSTGLFYFKVRAAAHEKAWGSNDPRLMRDYAVIAQTYAVLKEYRQAAQYADKVLSMAHKNKNEITALQAIKFRDKMNKLIAGQSAKHQ